MKVGTAAADTSSVFPALGSNHDVDVATRVDNDADDGSSQRVRIQPIDTRLNLHFKKTQARLRFSSVPMYNTHVVLAGCFGLLKHQPCTEE